MFQQFQLQQCQILLAFTAASHRVALAQLIVPQKTVFFCPAWTIAWGSAFPGTGLSVSLY